MSSNGSQVSPHPLPVVSGNPEASFQFPGTQDSLLDLTNSLFVIQGLGRLNQALHNLSPDNVQYLQAVVGSALMAFAGVDCPPKSTPMERADKVRTAFRIINDSPDLLDAIANGQLVLEGPSHEDEEESIAEPVETSELPVVLTRQEKKMYDRLKSKIAREGGLTHDMLAPGQVILLECIPTAAYNSTELIHSQVEAATPGNTVEMTLEVTADGEVTRTTKLYAKYDSNRSYRSDDGYEEPLGVHKWALNGLFKVRAVKDNDLYDAIKKYNGTSDRTGFRMADFNGKYIAIPIITQGADAQLVYDYFVPVRATKQEIKDRGYLYQSIYLPRLTVSQVYFGATKDFPLFVS